MAKTFRRPAGVVLYAALVLFACQHAVLAQDKVAKIEEVLTQAHKYGQFNGAALVAENGRVVYKKGFGMANMEWGPTPKSQTTCPTTAPTPGSG
jgi:hypothetical protein